MRFAHKEHHQLFLEPEGWETSEVYVQGMNTSLPEDVQVEMLRTIPALRDAEVMRVGYAIEYDYVPPRQITAWLETKLVAGLFLAGQVNGTSGYEEAAGQGLMAGINAALAVAGRPPLLLERSQAYIGVMVDDLVTREILEPYRLLTSRAEHRLLLRQDNADERLTPIGYSLGLIDGERYERTQEKYERVRQEAERLSTTWLVPSLEFNLKMEEAGQEPLSGQMSAASLLCRPEMSYELLSGLLNGHGDGEMGAGALAAEEREREGDAPAEERISSPLHSAVAEQVEIRVRYEPYIRKQWAAAERARKLEQLPIPDAIDYAAIVGLRNEAREKLARFRPATVGMASRVSGVTSADVAVLLVTIEKMRRSSGAARNGAPATR